MSGPHKGVIIFTGRGPSVCGGGTRMFLGGQRGDQKKLATGRHRQTAPLLVKNDSSLSFTDIVRFPIVDRHWLMVP